MNEGATYRIEFLPPGARKSRVLVGRYLGFSRMMGNHAFDMRPHAGTVTLENAQIISAQAVEPVA
jgi:hypothetical protein